MSREREDMGLAALAASIGASLVVIVGVALYFALRVTP